jgi:hypothetical protein
LHKVASVENKKIEFRLLETNKQFARVREEVEMWQMRNEELETKILSW